MGKADGTAGQGRLCMGGRMQVIEYVLAGMGGGVWAIG